MTQSSPVTWEVEIRVNGESHLTIGSNHLAGDPNVNEEIVEKCARHLLSFIGRPTPETQERIAELQYEAGMYQSLYENAISAVAAGAPNREAGAFELWQRFAPTHHIGWADETHKAEYYAAVDGVLTAIDAPAQGSGVQSAAERVVWFDWSGNDPDAVAAMDALRSALSSANRVSQEAMDWAASEAGAIEQYKAANPNWESELKSARELITPSIPSTEGK